MQKPDSDEEVATLFDMVQKVFQKLLECMARSFRKQPEEGLRVLTRFQDGLSVVRQTVLTQQTRVHGDASPHTQAQLALACAVGLLGGGTSVWGIITGAVLEVVLADHLQSVAQAERWCCLHLGQEGQEPTFDP